MSILGHIPAPAWIVRVWPERRLEASNTAGQQRLLDVPGLLEPVVLALALGAPVPSPFESGPVLEFGDTRWSMVVETGAPVQSSESRLQRLRDGWGLTPRQCEVTMLVLEGRSNKEISERLSTSVRTVEVHVSAVLRRLNVSSRAELIAHFFRDPQPG